jgi:3-oxoacyl-[acyl-carrier-protein] synthase II
MSPFSERDTDRHENRVVITGIGVVSSIGIGVDEFFAGLRTGRHGAKPITSFDTTGFERHTACEITDFDPAAWLENTATDAFGRASQLSASAARMAVRDAGMPVEELRGKRALVSVGTTNGEGQDFDRLSATQVEHGLDHLDPHLAGRIGAGNLATVVARELALTDVETVTIGTACAAGNYALGYGLDALRAGEVDVALCGGADALCRKTFAGFYRLGTIAKDACQPFDRNRSGILTGEGASVLQMETLDSAVARGARIYAEILGYALNCDANHPVAPDRDSIARCIALAHRDAGVKPDDIDLISAHGTGTKANDRTEAAAIHDVFPAGPPPTISIKSMLGHAMGAASALATAACALALAHGVIPPTINHVETDPECDLDCVPNEARPADLRLVQNNALAFGGNNAVLILARAPEAG